MKKLIYFLLIISIFYSFFMTKNISSKYKNEETITGYINNYYVKDNKLYIELIGKEKILCIYNYENIPNYKLGDTLYLEGYLTIPTTNVIFNGFSYKNYLKYEGINYIFNVKNIKKVSDNTKIKYKIKNYILERIKSIPNNEYLYTFILGSNRCIPLDVMTSYRNNGISHLFSISGMHISIITFVILKIFNKSKTKEIIVILFLIFYMFLTSYTPSVLRSSILFILITLNKKYKLNISNINIMILLLSVCIFIDPFIIYKIGFQYSYIITFSLIYFNELITKYKSKIYKSFIVSLISFLVSIPISINNFYQINFLGIFLNLIFIPLVSTIVFPFSLLTFFIPNNIFIYITTLLEKLSLYFSNIDVFILSLSKMSILLVIVYYVVIFIIIKSILKNNYKNLLFLVLLMILHKNINCFNTNLKTIYLSVGEADSILITFPHDKSNILIDTGNYDKYLSIESYLKSIGINTLDYMIITHGDADHTGEAINLVNNFKVENVVFNCGEYNELEQELIKVLDKKKIKYYSCIKELNIDKYKLEFLNTKEYDNENDNSNVIYFNYDEYKFLFMGDAGIEKEKDILDKYNLKDIDFLKVGHHGSNTSSSEYFINMINPKYSLISVGKNNRYGHPKDEVLETLRNSKIYRTDLDGSIEIKLNKNGYKIRTCPP